MQGDWAKLSDPELIAALKDGKTAAFTALVDRHQRSLINYFFHLSWDRQVSEDCAQDVFLRLYSHIGTYEPQAKFTTFLYRIARNLWIDRVRSMQAHGRPVSLQSPVGFTEDRTLQDRLPAGAPTPVDIIQRQETHQALKDAIARLPEEQKSVLVFSEIQGMKYQEIADILEIPVGTVKSRMFTAMEKLKEMLEDLEV